MFNVLSPKQGSAEISKEELFSTPSFISAKIDPMGKVLAYVGADDFGVSNVFITDDLSLRSIQQTSFFKSPDIIQFFWAADGSKILVLKDEEGKGQLNLYGIDTKTKQLVLYTEKLPKVNAKVIHVSPKENKAVIGLNHRDPKYHDLYILDLNSGKFTLLFKNESYAKFLISDDLEIILKMKILDDGSWTVYTREDGVFMQLSPSEAFQTEFLKYDEETNQVYLLDNRFSDTNQFIAKSLDEQGEEKVLGHQKISDVDEVLFVGGRPQAYASYYTQKKWHLIDPSIKEDFQLLEQHLGSNFEVISQNANGKYWVILTSVPDEGNHFWIYHRDTCKIFSLFSPQTQHSFSKMYPMLVTARDGKKLVCYYTLPKKFDKGGYIDSPLPLVVFPHGGPFKVRDKYEFNPFHQWLADCGYAALSVNFRLSSGFGKEFVNAGNGQWGKKAHLDVIDAVRNCVEKNITSEGKIAILGGSYGGYEALAGLTFTPDVFSCGVAICGPSNLKTVLSKVPDFWEFTSKLLSDKMLFFTKRAFIISMGGDEIEGAKYLEECSPLNYAEDIKAPLLLIHGRNDHIVKEAESRQIYEKMIENGKSVTYIVFPDEGHRIARFPNKIFFLDYAERFLSQHLKGKYVPMKQDLLMQSSGKISNEICLESNVKK